MSVQCRERFLDDVVRVDVVRDEDMELGIPSLVGGVTEETASYTPSMTLAQTLPVPFVNDYEPAPLIVLADTGPQGKNSSAITQNGQQYTHEVTLTVEDMVAEAVSWAQQMYGVDFHVVLYTDSGERLLICSLPGASVISIEENIGTDHTATLKAKVVSRSGLIRLK